VEMDVTGGNNFTDMGTIQLLGVPYALQANKLTIPFIHIFSGDSAQFSIALRLMANDKVILKVYQNGGATEYIFPDSKGNLFRGTFVTT